MKFLLRSLLVAFLSALSSSASSETFVVTQSPDVSVLEGETVEIACCWTGEAERMTVNWLKDQTTIKSEAVLKNLSQASLRKETSDCLNLTIPNIIREDSGNYTCSVSVEIPFLDVFKGRGTVVTVTAREKTKDNTRGNTKGNTKDNTDPSIAGGPDWEEVLIYVLRCLPILALVMSFLYLNSLGTKAQQHTPAAPGSQAPSAQIIEENQEEEEREEREAE